MQEADLVDEAERFRESFSSRTQLLFRQLLDLFLLQHIRYASNVVEWPDEVLKLIINNVIV